MPDDAGEINAFLTHTAYHQTKTHWIRTAIIVEIHVQRLVNAWGYVHTSTPRQTLKALEAKLPKQYWTEFNRWLEPFDKYACSAKHRDTLKPETRALCSSR